MFRFVKIVSCLVQFAFLFYITVGALVCSFVAYLCTINGNLLRLLFIYGSQSCSFREHWSHHRTGLARPTRSKSICNMRMHMHMHIHALTDTLSQSARVRWPDCSPPLRAIIGQKAKGHDRHWAFDNVSICCVCHSDSKSMLLRAREKHAA